MRTTALLALLLFALGGPARAGEEPAPAAPAAPAQAAPVAGEELFHLDLTVNDFGLGLGNSKHIDGLRLNYRDFGPSVVHGINITLWSPEDPARGQVVGLSLGLPLTGSGDVTGLALGLGVSATRRLRGLTVAPLGAGSGEGIDGVLLAGLGAGTGGNVNGLVVGGLGIGAGGDLTGIGAGGLGAGAGGNVTGLFVGGLGVGAGGRMRGIAFGGVGVGAGGDLEGLALGGVGVGAGGSIRGLAIGGVGVGAGGSIDGVALALVGVGAPRIHGLTASLAAGGREVTGLVLAPAFFNIEPEGRFTGFAISAVNRIRGEQEGLVIGLFNYAASLHGVQLGLINWAGNNPSGLKLLPFVNAHL